MGEDVYVVQVIVVFFASCIINIFRISERALSIMFKLKMIDKAPLTKLIIPRLHLV